MEDDKIQFFDIDSERNIIRHLCTDKMYIQKVVLNNSIMVEHFSDLFHRDVFVAITNYYKSYGTLPDESKFVPYLQKHMTRAPNFKDKSQQMTIWKSACKKIFNSAVVNESSLKSDFDCLEEYRKARLIQRSLVSIHSKFKSNEYDQAFSIMSSALLDSRIDSDIVLEGEISQDWPEHVQYMNLQRSGAIKPVPSGLFGVKEDESGNGQVVYLDNWLYGGFYPSDLAIVVGETSVGKSFFLMESAYQASYGGKNAIYFTIEMNKMKAQRRIYSRMSGLDYGLFRSASLTKNQEDFVNRRLQLWKEKCGTLYVVSFDNGATCQQIEEKMNQTQDRLGLEWEMLVIDYLNDMKPMGRYNTDKSWEAMGEISWGLANLAKNFNNYKGIPVLSANQKKATKAGKSHTNWEDAAFSSMVMHHCSLGFGLGADQDDKDAGRVRFDMFKNREGEANFSMFTYPSFHLSRITSMRNIKEYYGSDLVV
jgi:hypothetical protein